MYFVRIRIDLFLLQLPPATILIRPSMVKIETHPELSGVRSVNSSEIVSARNAKKSLSGVQSVNSFEIVSTRYQKSELHC